MECKENPKFDVDGVEMVCKRTAGLSWLQGSRLPVQLDGAAMHRDVVSTN